MIKKLFNKYSSLSHGVKAGLWFTFCNLVQKGISFITMPIFTRIMSQADYGIYNTYLSWYNFLLIFTSLNLSYYIFSKGMVKYEEDRDEFVLSLQSLSTTTTLIVFVIYILLRNYANKWLGLTTSLMLCMFVHLLLEPSVAYWTARKRFEYDYVRVVAVTIAMSLLNPILGIIMVLGSNNDVFARALSASITYLLFGVVLYIVIQKRSHKVFSTKYWKYALTFNLPLIPHFLSSTALSQADRVMITNMTGADNTALYSVAYSLGMVTLLFSQAIQQALLPWQYTKLKNNDYKDIQKVPSITMVIVMGINILFIAFAPEVMSIIAPKSYAEAIWAVPPVCSAVFFMYLFNLFADIEYYFEESKYVAVASILAALLNIGLNYIFIPIFGYIAAGYTTLGCYIMLAISHYICMKVICKKNSFNIAPYNIKFALFVSIALLIIMVLITIFYRIAIIRYLIIAIIIVVAMVSRNKITSVLNTISKKN